MDPFATLGLARRYDLDQAELESRYRELQKALHPDKHTGESASARRMTLTKAVEVNEAYRTLRDEIKRAEALLVTLGGSALSGQREPADPELLMEVMELREALGTAKDKHDLPAVQRLAAQVTALRATTRDALVAAFATLPVVPSAEAIKIVSALVSRLKYYQRFLDEVTMIEEEAETA